MPCAFPSQPAGLREGQDSQRTYTASLVSGPGPAQSVYKSTWGIKRPGMLWLGGVFAYWETERPLPSGTPGFLSPTATHTPPQQDPLPLHLHGCPPFPTCPRAPVPASSWVPLPLHWSLWSLLYKQLQNLVTSHLGVRPYSPRVNLR